DRAQLRRGDDVVVVPIIDRPTPGGAADDGPVRPVVELLADVLNVVGEVGAVEEVLAEGGGATDHGDALVARLPAPGLERLPLRRRPEASPERRPSGGDDAGGGAVVLSAPAAADR